MGCQMGVELGPGGFQFGAVVEHGTGLAALHVGVQLLGVVGGGGRLHGQEELSNGQKLHVRFTSFFLFYSANVMGRVPRRDGGCVRPILWETPSHTDGFCILYIGYFPSRIRKNSRYFPKSVSGCGFVIAAILPFLYYV